jgi:type I pantothenate kinase
MSALDAADALADRAVARTRSDGAAVLAIAGPVAVGKSTLARILAAALVARGVRAESVSTDGFLFPGAVLTARGLMNHKGFPDSYDVDQLHQFLASARAGAQDIPVPEYSHETYDVVSDGTRALPRVDVLVLEGVNALSSTVGLVDLGVYLHADDDVVEMWFVERFRAYCADPPPGSFYEHFDGLDADAIDSLAHNVWRTVNLVNLRDYIAPSRRFANVIVEKMPDHRVGTIVDVSETITP